MGTPDPRQRLSREILHRVVAAQGWPIGKKGQTTLEAVGQLSTLPVASKANLIRLHRCRQLHRLRPEFAVVGDGNAGPGWLRVGAWSHRGEALVPTTSVSLQHVGGIGGYAGIGHAWMAPEPLSPTP